MTDQEAIRKAAEALDEAIDISFAKCENGGSAPIAGEAAIRQEAKAIARRRGIPEDKIDEIISLADEIGAANVPKLDF